MKMSDNEKASSGANPETSGSGIELDAASSGATEGKTDLVAKLKKEKDNWKAKAEELLNKQKLAEEESLKAKEQYKVLYENRTKEVEEYKAKLVKIEDGLKKEAKSKAVEKELFKLGLSPEYSDTVNKLMDWNLVNLDPETNLVIGAEEAAKGFYEKHNALGFFKKTGPGVNHNAPNTGAAPGNSYDTEIRAAKTQKEIDAVLKKYNMV